MLITLRSTKSNRYEAYTCQSRFISCAPMNKEPRGVGSFVNIKIGYFEMFRLRISYDASFRVSDTVAKSLVIVPKYLPFSSGSLFIYILFKANHYTGYEF